jgi:predicted PurR-regulated permease PerM
MKSLNQNGPKFWYQENNLPMIDKLKLCKDFVVNHYKTISIVLGGLFLLYWIIFILTPVVQMSEQSVEQLKKIDENISNLEFENKILQSEIVEFQEQIESVNENIEEIDEIKITLANDYGKKISNARSYNHDELVRFLSERYDDNRIY